MTDPPPAPAAELPAGPDPYAGLGTEPDPDGGHRRCTFMARNGLLPEQVFGTTPPAPSDDDA